MKKRAKARRKRPTSGVAKAIFLVSGQMMAMEGHVLDLIGDVQRLRHRIEGLSQNRRVGHWIEVPDELVQIAEGAGMTPTAYCAEALNSYAGRRS